MLNTKSGSVYSGKFEIDGKRIEGELTFDLSDTRLSLHHPEFFRPDQVEDRCVLGILRDLTKVSLIQCLLPQLPGTSSVGGIGRYNTATVRPHFILHGYRHLRPKDREIRSLEVVVSDAATIFPDYDAFGFALGATAEDLRPLLQKRQRASGSRIKLGKIPDLAYYSGKHNIFTVKTLLGTISADHRPTMGSAGPHGLRIDNTIVVRMTFPKLLDFVTAMSRLSELLPFFTILAGRRQEVKSLSLQFRERQPQLSTLNVYWCNPPQRQREHGREVDVIDLPINAVREVREFKTILAKWISRQGEWKDARAQFVSSFAKENMFDYDRLIGSANMFDLLPKSAVPKAIPLDKDLRAAKSSSQAIFKALNDSPERSSMLSALGRLGKPSLKRKVRHRAAIVLAALPGELHHLCDVLDMAVDARNHLVHGAASEIDFTGNFFETISFFCKALEFVFLTSDLVEMGWEIERWRQQGSTLSHPLASFIYNYTFYLRALAGILPDTHRLKPVFAEA